jgi:hypothetical protein
MATKQCNERQKIQVLDLYSKKKRERERKEGRKEKN